MPAGTGLLGLEVRLWELPAPDPVPAPGAGSSKLPASIRLSRTYIKRHEPVAYYLRFKRLTMRTVELTGQCELNVKRDR